MSRSVLTCFLSRSSKRGLGSLAGFSRSPGGLSVAYWPHCWDPSQVPWSEVIDSKTPTKVLLFLYECQIHWLPISLSRSSDFHFSSFWLQDREETGKVNTESMKWGNIYMTHSLNIKIMETFDFIYNVLSFLKVI